MKLERDRSAPRTWHAAAMRAVVASALAPVVFATGCASSSSPSSRAAVPVTEALTAPVVGTTHLMAADLTSAEEALRVGKSHRTSLVEENGAKRAPEHRANGRPAGGFSGYK